MNADIAKKIFSNRLRGELNRLDNMSQKTLAEKMKLAPGTINNYVKARRIPEMEKLLIMADMFGCSIDYLIGRTDIRNINLPDTPKELSEVTHKLKDIEDALAEYERMGEIDDTAKREILRDTTEYLLFKLSQKKM